MQCASYIAVKIYNHINLEKECLLSLLYIENILDTLDLKCSNMSIWRNRLIQHHVLSGHDKD